MLWTVSLFLSSAGVFQWVCAHEDNTLKAWNDTNSRTVGLDDELRPFAELPGLLALESPVSLKMSPQRLSAALAWARKKVAEYEEEHKNLGRPARKFNYHFSHKYASDPAVRGRAREALIWAQAALAPEDLSEYQGREAEVDCSLPPTPDCDLSNAKYRSQDGACNHPTNPLWGAADVPLVRLRPNTLEDGLNQPRSLARSGAALPSPRLISQTVTSDTDIVNPALTMTVTDWGQFLDHDITRSLETTNALGELPTCCVDGAPPLTTPPCFTIPIPADDPFYSQHSQQCMEFVRTVPALPPTCSPAARMPENVLTAYIDASTVYGSSEERVALVRDPSRPGELKMTGDGLLPPEPEGFHNELPCLSDDPETEPCFLAGDDRVNDQTGLTALHTIWVREHNRIARKLKTINKRWGSDRVFQEARKIVSAEIQHITYTEWLPIILGKEFLVENQIDALTGSKYSERYLEVVNPGIAAEFSTAAFRFGHTLLQGLIRLYKEVKNPPPAVSQTFMLRDIFLNPGKVYSGLLDEIAIGLITFSPQTFDANFVEDITEFLFKHDQPFGLDLVSLNIQRGRDHGIATYNTMREMCGLGRAASFDDLLGSIPAAVVQRLSQVYEHVDDVDLFIGGISETPFPGAVVGPTFRCIIGNQFIRLRWGDNFFYDLGGPERPWSFTTRQVKTLRRASWARVLCDNVASIKRIQKKAFMAPDVATNKIQDCKFVPDVDLYRWQGK